MILTVIGLAAIIVPALLLIFFSRGGSNVQNTNTVPAGNRQINKSAIEKEAAPKVQQPAASTPAVASPTPPVPTASPKTVESPVPLESSASGQ